jgi:hypothetical protein
MSPISADGKPGAASVDIHVEAHDNRGALEALYLELREMAKLNGLKIELRLDQAAPEDPPAR